MSFRPGSRNGGNRKRIDEKQGKQYRSSDTVEAFGAKVSPKRPFAQNRSPPRSPYRPGYRSSPNRSSPNRPGIRSPSRPKRTPASGFPFERRRALSFASKKKKKAAAVTSELPEDERVLDVAKRILKEIHAREMSTENQASLNARSLSTPKSSPVGQTSATTPDKCYNYKLVNSLTPPRPEKPKTEVASSSVVQHREPVTPTRSGFWGRRASSKSANDKSSSNETDSGVSASSTPNSSPAKGLEKRKKKGVALVKPANAVEDELQHWQQQLADALDKISLFNNVEEHQTLTGEAAQANPVHKPALQQTVAAEASPCTISERTPERTQPPMFKQALIKQTIIAGSVDETHFNELPLAASPRTLGALAATQRELLKAFEEELQSLKMDKELADAKVIDTQVLVHRYKEDAKNGKQTIREMTSELESSKRTEVEARKAKKLYEAMSSKVEKSRLKIGELELELISAQKVVVLFKAEQKARQSEKIGKLAHDVHDARKQASLNLKICELEFELDAARKVASLLKAEQKQRDDDRILKFASDLEEAQKKAEFLRADHEKSEVEHAEAIQLQRDAINELKQSNEQLQLSNEEHERDLHALRGRASRLENLESLNTMLVADLEDHHSGIWDSISAGTLQLKLDACEQEKQVVESMLATATDRLLFFESCTSSEDLYREELKESRAAEAHVAKKHQELIVKNNAVRAENELATAALKEELAGLKTAVAVLQTKLDATDRQLSQTLPELKDAEKKLLTNEKDYKDFFAETIETETRQLKLDLKTSQEKYAKETIKLARMLDQVCKETDIVQEEVVAKTAQLAVANEHISKLLCLRADSDTSGAGAASKPECID